MTAASFVNCTEDATGAEYTWATLVFALTPRLNTPILFADPYWVYRPAAFWPSRHQFLTQTARARILSPDPQCRKHSRGHSRLRTDQSIPVAAAADRATNLA